MTRFNPDTYPDRQAFDAYARALRRKEFDRLAAAGRVRLTLALQRVRGVVARGAGPVADVSMTASLRRGTH
jgi:hypothetical protein